MASEKAIPLFSKSPGAPDPGKGEDASAGSPSGSPVAGGFDPEFRSEKVERLKRLIRTGNYRIDPDAIAERMLKEHLGIEP
jgi:flagellar biosynthesis anti-sigma factor FlgM